MASENGDRETPVDASTRWKALSHPLRIRVLQLIQDEALTNEELARRLGVASGKLYFHTKRLLDAGLIHLVETRQKGPLTEKLYRAVPGRVTAPPLAKGGDSPPLEAMLIAAAELYRSSWLGSDGLPGQPEWGFHLVLPQTAERRREFLERLKTLVRDFQLEPDPEADVANAPMLALTVLMHGVPLPETDSQGDA